MKEWGDNNPYYHPDKCGLEIVGELDEPRDYEFNMFVVFRDIESGKLYYGQDAGCSCPTQFEDFHSLKDLTEIHNAWDFRIALRDWAVNTSDFSTRVNALEVQALADRIGLIMHEKMRNEKAKNESR